MITPYLTFNGQCEEAFELYQRAFDAPAAEIARYGDAVQPQQARVMHAYLQLTETGAITGADTSQPIPSGSAVSLHAHCSTFESARTALSVLSEGSANATQLVLNPPPHDDGVSAMVTDRFGITWVLSAPCRT
ncbi:VOC family protein [Cellulosimicrobium cellulans]|uniref:VOC family protein n=1 Tax=Cellulosimicrobium cellulans TaxID=1710 RepID=UPI00130D8945|nr:VOC family protein [Cellulosimicrobium cellulans]